MIKAAAKGANGRDLLVLGLSFGNLDKFRAQPRDTFVKIDGREMGIPMDVLIFSCETEAHGAEMMQDMIGPQTQVSTSRRLKS